MASSNSSDDNSNKNDHDHKSTKKGGSPRPSILVRLIRHAESRNNQVYRDARQLYRTGTPDFDVDGWNRYVEEHRSADPSLSDMGLSQRDRLADFLVPHLKNQASSPVRVICSPMRRTLDTIHLTLSRLQNDDSSSSGGDETKKVQIIVHGKYHESDGCHLKGVTKEGMAQDEIRELLNDCTSDDNLKFLGFPQPDRGWYVNGKGAETRQESESRASQFYIWLCEHLDQQLRESADVFDAGVSIAPEEAEEQTHDFLGPRLRRRRTTLLVGHGDFMSLILKRIVMGFGHYIESEGIPHRSAFVHANTGFTDIEYFGKGRFLLMATNQTPHFVHQEDYAMLRGGDSLKDGWSFLMPLDEHLEEEIVAMAYEDEGLDQHVKDQLVALQSLYLPSKQTINGSQNSCSDPPNSIAVEEQEGGKLVTFLVKHGLQVVAFAKYNEESGEISNVIIRPSATESDAGVSLVTAIRSHARQLGRSGSLLIHTSAHKTVLEKLGFAELNEEDGTHVEIDI